MSSEIHDAHLANLNILASASEGSMFVVLRAPTEPGGRATSVGSSSMSFPTIFLLRSLAVVLLSILARLDNIERGRS